MGGSGVDWNGLVIAILGATTTGLCAWAIAHRKHDQDIERWRGTVDSDLASIKEEVSTLGSAVTVLAEKRSDGDGELHRKIDAAVSEVHELATQLRELVGILRGAGVLNGRGKEKP